MGKSQWAGTPTDAGESASPSIPHPLPLYVPN